MYYKGQTLDPAWDHSLSAPRGHAPIERMVQSGHSAEGHCPMAKCARARRASPAPSRLSSLEYLVSTRTGGAPRQLHQP